MNTRARSKAGRGHSREEWNQVHQRLVQIKDRSGSTSRREKVAKLTSLLRERENITEHERDASSKEKKTHRVQDTSAVEVGNLLPNETVRNDCFFEEEESDENQGTKMLGRENSHASPAAVQATRDIVRKSQSDHNSSTRDKSTNDDELKQDPVAMEQSNRQTE